MNPELPEPLDLIGGNSLAFSAVGRAAEGPGFEKFQVSKCFRKFQKVSIRKSNSATKRRRKPVVEHKGNV